MANEMMSLTIDKAMLTPVIEQQVKLLMTEILGGKDVIVEKVIKNMMSTKVDENGKPTSYGNGKPFFEWLLIDEIKKCVKEILEEEIADRRPTIKTLVRKYIQSDKGSQEITDALIGGLVNNMTEFPWRTNIEVNFESIEK